jgi:hypothetical protein
MNRYADDTDKADERGLYFFIYNSIAQLFKSAFVRVPI